LEERLSTGALVEELSKETGCAQGETWMHVVIKVNLYGNLGKLELKQVAPSRRARFAVCVVITVPPVLKHVLRFLFFGKS